MAGPISTAFVNIVARLRLDRAKSDLAIGLRSSISEIEDQLSKLEGAAFSAGRAVARQLGGLRVNLDVGDALKDMTRVESSTEQLVESLRQVRDRKIGIDANKATRDINRLEEVLSQLSRQVQVLDGDEIDLNVSGAVSQLRNLERVAIRLEEQLEQVTNKDMKPEVGAALANLQRMREFVDRVLTALTRVNTSTVRVNVNDLQLENLEAELRQLEGKVVDIKVRADTTGLGRVSRGVERLNVNLNDFGDQFRNIAFRAVSYFAVGQAMNALGQVIRMGVEAAGQIQTVTVGLNRLFADMPQLGATASEFLGDLRRVAIETPFEFIELADTSRRLVQLGGDADEAISRMVALADAGAAVGATSEDINGVVRALSQLYSKGRVNLQDLNQIAERLPNFQRTLQVRGVIEELRELGHPAAETVKNFDDIRAAGIEIETVVNGIFRGLSLIPGAAGASAAQARTLEGALSNLRDFFQIEFASSFAGVGELLADELNSAFSEITGEAEETTSELAQGFQEVISAFGVAAERALPAIFELLEDSSDEAADLATALGELVRSLASGFTGDLFKGLLDGFTNTMNAATALNDMLGSILPKGVSQGIGEIATELIVLTRIFGPGVIAPFQRFINDVIFGMKSVRDGAMTARGALGTIGPSAAKAGAAAVGLVALNLVLDDMATKARRMREVEQATDSAVQALSEFNDVGLALDSWLENFVEAGEGINLGNLEKHLDGITAPELIKNLGVTEDKLLGIFDAIIASGGSLESAKARLKEFGETGGDLDTTPWFEFLESFDLLDVDPNTLANLEALADQFNTAAEEAFTAGIFTGRWAQVSEDTAAKIGALAAETGNYIQAVQSMNEAQQDAARSLATDLAESIKLTDPEFRAIIRNFTDAETGTVNWTGVLGDLYAGITAVDDAMLDLESKFPDLIEFVDNLGQMGDAPARDVQRLAGSFAVWVDSLQLTEEEYDALAKRLATPVSGEELAAFVDATVEKFDELNEAFEEVILGLDDLQLEADGFSLDAFIEELERIAEARRTVVENLGALLDEYGQLGKQIIEGLIQAELDPDIFALAIQELVDASRPEVERVGELIGEISTNAAEEIVSRLVGMGIREDQAREILGLDGFESAAADLDGVADTVEGFADRVEDAFSGRGPLTEEGLAGLTENLYPELFKDANSSEILEAVERAGEAGDNIGAEFGGNLTEALESTSAAMLPILLRHLDLAQRLVVPVASLHGESLGREYVRSLVYGLHMSSYGLYLTAVTTGKTISWGLVEGFVQSRAFLIAAALRTIDLTLQAMNRYAQIASPSRLFGKVGSQLGEGLAEGMLSTVPLVQEAARQLAAGAVPDLGDTRVSAGMGAAPLGAAAVALADGGTGRTFREVLRAIESRGPGGDGGPAAAGRTVHIEQTFNEKVDPMLLSAELAWKLG